MKLKTKVVSTFDGWYGKPRRVLGFVEPPPVISSHSCLLPSFSVTMRVGELKKLVADLEDDDGLTVTVSEGKAPEFTFVR